MNNNVITVSHLKKSVKDKEILKDISFNIQQGECVALIGPNGAGKTTLMSCLLGDVRYNAGQVSLLGQTSQTQFLKEKVAILFQENLVQNKMKVKELIAFQKAIYKESLPDERIVEMLGFSDKQLNSFASQLSGGQKRLLQFVLIMIGQPDLIFLDEPTAGMDTNTRHYFWQLIDELKAKGKTIVYSSHYIEEVEHTADRILVLHQGSLIRDTTPYALRNEEKQKVFTIPITYRDILSRLEDLADVEYKQDNITFSTYQPEKVWAVLQDANCPIADIEMMNRTLLDLVFEIN